MAHADPAQGGHGFRLVKEDLFQIGFDLQLPDVGQRTRQVGAQKKGVADGVMSIANLPVDPLQQGN